MSVPGFIIGQTLAKQAKSPTGQSIDDAGVQRLSVLGLVVGANPLGIVMLKTLADKEAEKLQPPAPTPQPGTPPETAVVVPVPEVVGKQRSDAEEALKRAGFQVQLNGLDPQNPDRQMVVDSQFPAAGTKAVQGSAVLLFLKPATTT